MKYLAQINSDSIVVNIIVANDDWDTEGFVEYTESNPACIGGTYTNGKFIPRKPSDDAIYDEQTNTWIVPGLFSNISFGADTQ